MSVDDMEGEALSLADGTVEQQKSQPGQRSEYLHPHARLTTLQDSSDHSGMDGFAAICDSMMGHREYLCS